VRIGFRVDASVAIGSGHVMRCLTLAERLSGVGATCEFVMTEGPGDLIELVADQHGHLVHRLPAAAAPLATMAAATEAANPWRSEEEPLDWLVVDHYALASAWELGMRGAARRLMVIDDLADRRHDCDLLLDQNLHENTTPYRDLVPADCVTLLGPRYALLRREFSDARLTTSREAGPVERLLITFGGSDPTNETVRALEQLADAGAAGVQHVDVVVGGAAANLAAVTSLAATLPSCRVHVQVSDIATLMSAADLCIGAGGSTMWERCCLGLPTLMVAVADHQVQFCRRLDHLGYARYIGNAAERPVEYLAALRAALAEPEILVAMAAKGMRLVDGQGADRVVKRMMETS